MEAVAVIQLSVRSMAIRREGRRWKHRIDPSRFTTVVNVVT